MKPKSVIYAMSLNRVGCKPSLLMSADPNHTVVLLRHPPHLVMVPAISLVVLWPTKAAVVLVLLLRLLKTNNRLNISPRLLPLALSKDRLSRPVPTHIHPVLP